MIIVGELILAAAMNQMRKTKKEKKKKKTDAVFSCWEILP